MKLSFSASSARQARRSGRSSRLEVRAEAKQVTLLDYGAGNVRSVRNALKALGYEVRTPSSLT
jgi:hypothetical protein